MFQTPMKIIRFVNYPG